MFMPDATYGYVRGADARDLDAAGIRGVVVNTLHLYNKLGVKGIKRVGGIHTFMRYDGMVLSDSGGYQAYSMLRQNPSFGTIRPNELVLRQEDGGVLRFTPRRCIEMQHAIGSDVSTCLDLCTHPDAPYDEQLRSVQTSLRWAKECRAVFDQLHGKRTHRKLFGIIQGGADRDLRLRCAEGLSELGLDGYGYGGWPLDSDGNLLYDMLAYTADLMPDGAVKYAMGVGKPHEVVACHKMGYTLFDCVIPTREARHHRLYVFNAQTPHELHVDDDFYSMLYIMDDRHAMRDVPVSTVCDCHTCRNYSVGYLRHLYQMNDALAIRLGTIHNLRFYAMLMGQLRR